jgi:hypothetical protein
MQQIADWLEKLGMSEYARRFAENGINLAALPHLNRSRPKGHWRPARASPEDAGRHRRDDRHVPRGTCFHPSARGKGSRHCRTPPSRRDVLRLGRLNGPFGLHGP